MAVLSVMPKTRTRWTGSAVWRASHLPGPRAALAWLCFWWLGRRTDLTRLLIGTAIEGG